MHNANKAKLHTRFYEPYKQEYETDKQRQDATETLSSQTKQYTAEKVSDIAEIPGQGAHYLTTIPKRRPVNKRNESSGEVLVIFGLVPGLSQPPVCIQVQAYTHSFTDIHTHILSHTQKAKFGRPAPVGLLFRHGVGHNLPLHFS